MLILQNGRHGRARAVIEKVTGVSLEAFVTEQIAKPLGIQSFVFKYLRPFALASCS